MKKLKRALSCIILITLATLTTRAQALCIIDGVPLPDSLLHVTIDEMRSDSPKQIVSHRLGLIPPQAIESTQTFSAEEQIKQAKNITSCKTPRDIIIIRTNSLAELQWVIDGKLRKPRKKLTIIDYKLSPQCIMEALPRRIKPTDIGSVNIITYINDPRQEKHPTIVIKTKTSNRLPNQRSLTEERNEEEVMKRK
ncbi:MAG: 50S ribosomal protein L19 [Prevotella fusca]|uniref:50S ribosomal protein L19 n=1 Tax=Prevotella fusca TaxID=589436 RepID=UPI003F9FC021